MEDHHVNEVKKCPNSHLKFRTVAWATSRKVQTNASSFGLQKSKLCQLQILIAETLLTVGS